MAVQHELEATTERQSIDEGESRHSRGVQLVEDGMSDPGNCQGLLSADDLGKFREVSTRCHDEWLAGDRNRHDVISHQRSIQSAIELTETTRAKGVGPRMITPVVKCDQHRSSGRVWQSDVAAQCPGDDLALAASRRGGDEPFKLLGFQRSASEPEEKCGFSQITAPPMPRPMHSVVRP